MEYMVRFTGHIDENKRPDGFAYEVYSDIFFDAKSPTELRDNIKSMYKIFAAQQCMLVPSNPDAIQNDESRFDYDSLIYVPMHMLTSISTKTKMLSGGVPKVNQDGHPELSDGTKVWKQ